MASAGDAVGLLHVDDKKEDVPITVGLARSSRSDLYQLMSLKLRAGAGGVVALGEFASIESTTDDKSIYHKNLMPVTYVTADLAGDTEGPVYAMLKIQPDIEQLSVPEGYKIAQYTASLPPTACHPPTRSTQSSGMVSGI